MWLVNLLRMLTILAAALHFGIAINRTDIVSAIISMSSSSSSGEDSIIKKRRVRVVRNITNSLSQQDGKPLGNVERAEIMATGSEFRKFSFEMVESRSFNMAILVVILVNTVFIGLQTSEYIVAKADWYLTLVDQLFLAIYMTELALKLYAWRFKFFKSLWNVFDIAIIFASSVDFLTPVIAQNTSVLNDVFDNVSVFNLLRVFRAIKALRALRVMRTVRFFKNLQIIVSTVLQSIPAMGSIVILISLVLYIFAIIGRGLYGQVDPNRFGNVAQACFTLFQLMTLDDWFYTYSNIRDNYPEHQHILVYLILFILCETFIFVNLFVAVIVDNLARVQAAANYNKSNSKLDEKLSSENNSEVEVATKPKESVVEPAHSQQCSSASHFYKTSDEFSDREINLIGQHFMLLNSMEHHMALSRSHQRTFNELVDLADFSKS